MVAFASCILFHLVCWHRWKGVKKFGLKQCFRNWTKPSPSPPSNTEFRWVVCYVSLASARDYTRVVPASAGLACSMSCFVPNFIETSKQENVQIFAFFVPLANWFSAIFKDFIGRFTLSQQLASFLAPTCYYHRNIADLPRTDWHDVADKKCPK